LIQHVKEAQSKAVLLVTADRKEDWWWREQGKTVGPHPELIREIQRCAGVELFWMYSSDQFMEHAKKYSAATVSNESVAEIKQVSDLAAAFHALPTPRFVPSGSVRRFTAMRDNITVIQLAVENWLLSQYGDIVQRNPQDYPDFVVKHSDGFDHGYEIRYARTFDQVAAPTVVNSILRGYLETNERRISAFTLVLVISVEDYLQILEQGKRFEVDERLMRVMKRYPIDGIVVGSVVDDAFVVLADQKNPARAHLLRP
jgi:hypothetical protein